MSWSIVELGDLAEFRNGINYNQKNFGTGIKVIGVVNFQNYIKPRYNELEEVNPEGVVKDEDILQDNDILFVRSNGNKDLIGRSLFIESPPEPITFSGFCIRTRFTSNQAFPRFFAYLFRSDLIRKTLSAYGGGTNIANLNQKILSRLQVPLPPLATQQRIADILSTYDRLIDNNNRRIALLEESIHLVYKEWFVRSRFPDYESVKLVDGIPEGWKRVTLADICSSISYGFTASAISEDTGLKFLRITDIVPSVIDWSKVPYCNITENKKEQYLLKEGDLIVARTGATVGYAKRIHKRHPEVIFASYLVRMRLFDHVDNMMVGIFVESDEYKNYIKANVGGAAQPNANARIISGANILVPSKEIQKLFREKVEPIFDQKEILQIQTQRLKEARDLLLPRLMNGSIVV